MMAVNYERLPEELRWNRQWLLAGPSNDGKYKAPFTFNRAGHIYNASPVDPKHWVDYETAVEATQVFKPYGLGFVLTRTDNFTCIDLDIKNKHNEPDETKHTKEEDIQRFHKIIAAFDSYTERSASGQGYHIWVRGKVGAGLKRDGVELYSQDRFIVCTGDVYLDREIKRNQDMLDALVFEIREQQNEQNTKAELQELPQVEDDAAIWERAKNADNCDKFITLCSGNWDGYPSQSEADLALMSIFTFYTQSNEQCRRMFRQTKLGQRAKATKNDIALNRILQVIRGRQANEATVTDAAVASAAALVSKLQTSSASAANSAPHTNTPPQQTNATAPLNYQYDDIPTPEELRGPIATVDSDYVYEEKRPENIIPWPPGFIGKIAQYIFEHSPRPVREVSIVSALGFFAGIQGKAWNIPQSGLNLYIVLVAPSGVGKESMHAGISILLNQLANVSGEALKYVDFTDYASGPALIKGAAANPSFVNVMGEWGKKLTRLSNENGGDIAMQTLRTVMTNFYQKSAHSSMVGGLAYSDKEKNVGTISGLAYSMIGESTPGAFYDSLTDTMMEDGFLSRFTVIEYKGIRQAANEKKLTPLDTDTLTHLSEIISTADKAIADRIFVPVERNPEAKAFLNTFDLKCDAEINKTMDESWRQMWNRAHLKVCRIAANLAVADCCLHPVITLEQAEWALDVVMRDINIMRSRIDAGEVGTSDMSRDRKLLDLIKMYLSKPIPDGYGIDDAMRKKGIVPRKYLQISTQRSTNFTKQRNGQNSALDITIKSLMDSGYLVEVAKATAATEYNFHGRCFRVVSLPP